ncbi:MAG: hypothetical protein FJX80_12565 [Bacteroidetes bacterium]|nr:hypothetical protein [Bacteroidota bacterium]
MAQEDDDIIVLLKEVNKGSSISNISFHSSLPILANGSYSDVTDRSVQFFEVPGLEKVSSKEWGASKVNCVAFHPRLDVMLTGDANHVNNVKLWNVTTVDPADIRELVTLDGHRRVITCIAFHLILPFFATGSWDGTAKIWHYKEDDWSATKCIFTTDPPDMPDIRVTSVAFHPTQHIIAITSSSRGAKILDFSDAAAAATEIAVSRTIPSDITLGEHIYTTCVAFHPGPINFILAVGGHIITQGWRNTYSIKLWDYSPSIGNPTCVATLEGHTNNISSMIFHPSIPLLISGSEDRRVKFWGIDADIKKSTCVHTVQYQTDGVTSIAICPYNYSLLVTGTFNGMLRLYNIANLMSRLRMNHYYITPSHADLRRFYGEIHGIAQTTMLSKSDPFKDTRRRRRRHRGGNKTKRNHHKLSRKRYSRTLRKKRKSYTRNK